MTTPLAPYVLMFYPSARLWITPSRFKEWDALAAQGGIILWNREGMVRCVTNSVLKNAIQTYSDHRILQADGKILEMPMESQYITWDQAVAVNPKTYRPIKPT